MVAPFSCLAVNDPEQHADQEHEQYQAQCAAAVAVVRIGQRESAAKAHDDEHYEHDCKHGRYLSFP